MRRYNSLVISALPGPQFVAKRTRTKLKRKVARVTRVPTSRSGRKKKADRFSSNMVVVLFVIALISYFYFFLS